jgi:thymidylate synthase (FAD)
MSSHLILKKENIFNDNIAEVESWDFSRANLSQENRVNAITQVASVCYQNPKALNSDSLYNRLACESIGLPSSSFEFVPVLLDPSKQEHRIILGRVDSNARKFGEFIEENSKSYLLTNYRALIYDFEKRTENMDEESKESIRDSYLKLYNTEEECNIIKKHFKVFKYKVDLPTRSQMVRHRASWQELSRRYVSGKRVGFDFYVSEKMKRVISKEGYDEDLVTHSTQDIIDKCLNHYFKALEDGVKPEEARRIIPQAAYSTVWAAFMPMHLENYFKLRLDSHAQWEIQQTAIAMNELISKEF